MRTERRQQIVQRLIDAGPHLTGLYGEHSTSQPAVEYTDGERFVQEIEALFRHGPSFFALSGACPSPGDYLTGVVGRVPVAVVRQDTGALAGFVNACRHRGAPLFVGASGSMADRVSCGYHAWTYERDGRLAVRPATYGGFDDVTASCDLIRIDVAERHGLIFVQPVPGDAPIDVGSLVGPQIADDLDAFGISSYVHIETRVNTWPINWKLVLDTFCESYHLRTLHRDSLAPTFLSDPSVFEAHGRNLVSIGLRKTVVDEFDKPEAERDIVPYGTIEYFLVPSGLVVHQIDHLEVWRLEPIDARTTRTVTSLFAPVEPATERSRGYFVKNLDMLMAVVSGEDFALMAQIQQNLDSGLLPSLVFGRIEPALGHLHASINHLLAQSASRR